MIRAIGIGTVAADAKDTLKSLKTTPCEDGGVVLGGEERVTVVIEVGS
jgi:hypothetical protein